MALISLKDVSIQFGGPPVLQKITLNIEAGERACLTGRNGEGKSTLLKILAGTLEPDSGEIVRSPDLRVATLTQDVPPEIDGCVFDIVSESTAHLTAGSHHPGASKFITELKLDATAYFNALSGGQRRRVLLARALSSEPHLLLLDEPTNHLDIATIEWLETYLARKRFAVLFVTHDRSFLQRVANKVLDLDRGKLAGWDCDYRTFLERKQELLNDEMVYWEKQGRLLAKEEAWLRKGIKARRTRNEGRVASLMKLREQFNQRRHLSGVSQIEVNTDSNSGDQVIQTKNLSYAWDPEQPVIKNLNLRIRRGERIGIIGANGSGKTTLLNLLCGRLKPSSGMIKTGTRLSLCFLDQMRTELDPEKTILKNIADERDEVEINGRRKHVYGYLEEFLFSAERARTRVAALSGGERARLLLAKLFTRPGNLLVMDEPTNDLDLETLELLEEQLANFPGTLLLVSHDRSFLDNVVTSTIVIDAPDKIRMYPGGYTDWLQQRPTTATPVNNAVKKKNTRTQKTNLRLSFKEKLERDELPAMIEKLEEEIDDLQTKVADPSIYQSDPAQAALLTRRLPEAQTELEKLFDRWASVEERAIEAGEL
jgi:ABC transport system ATP-binding/permease protein